ncbi:hypothetical protein HK101_008151 [Irineochytrium annulatum]|nr:hypothetical protein HK101_008151 [Irineochytrium annulatum]
MSTLSSLDLSAAELALAEAGAPKATATAYDVASYAVRLDDSAVDRIAEAAADDKAAEVVVEAQLDTQFQAASLAQDFSIVAKEIAEVIAEMPVDKKPDQVNIAIDDDATAPANTTTVISSQTEIETKSDDLSMSTLWAITKRAISLSTPAISLVLRGVVAPTARTLAKHPRIQLVAKYAVLAALSPVILAVLAFTWPFVVAYRNGPQAFRGRIKAAMGAVVEEFRVVRERKEGRLITA